MTSIRTIHYAAPPPDYFWGWSSDHMAAEWTNGGTLSLWQELHPLLVFLDEEKGLPPLGAVLLLLAACREDWCTQSRDLEEWFSKSGVGDFWVGEAENFIDDLLAELTSVERLPKDLRASVQAKCQLLSIVFENGARLARNPSSEVMDELRLGGPRAVAGKRPDLDAHARFLRDAKAVVTGLAGFDARSLESRIRTGLEHPDLLGAKLPEEINPRDEGRPLLEVLTSLGGEQGAAAAVAKKAIAMMNLPGRVGTPRDLPVGGISDITNRGSIDRLLPAELAWDDLVLAARLVHNEALYFRREVPPSDIQVRHIVLLDRGLRFWGQARVLSLGVALGLAHHPSFKQDNGGIEVYGAGLVEDEALDLQTPEGVHMAIQALVPAPDPMEFLRRWHERLNEEDHPETADDFAFITAADHLENPDCRLLLGDMARLIDARGGLFRVITLERGGSLEIQIWSGGGHRTVFRGVLEEQDIIPPQESENPAGPPLASMPLRSTWNTHASSSPFLFPIIPSYRGFMEDGDAGGGLGISADRRLARWPKAGWGAEEICPDVPGREHWLDRDEDGRAIVIATPVTPGEPVRVYYLDGNSLVEIAIEKSAHSYPRFATVKGGAVLLCYSDLVEAFSLNSGHRLAELRGRPIPHRPLLAFDGQRILLHGPDPCEPLSTMARWDRNKDTSWTAMFSPESISLKNGVLRLKCGSELYTFDPIKLRLVIHQWGRKVTPLVSFMKKGEDRPGQPLKRLAHLGPKLTALHDSRGVLEIYDANGSGDAWHILLATPSASVWHSRRGLLSFDERLRQPSQSDPPAEALEDLRQFLRTAANHVIRS